MGFHGHGSSELRAGRPGREGLKLRFEGLTTRRDDMIINAAVSNENNDISRRKSIYPDFIHPTPPSIAISVMFEPLSIFLVPVGVDGPL